MNKRVDSRSLTYTPAPPWTDGQQVTRSSDGVLFIYSASLNALTVDPSLAGAAKDVGGFTIINVPNPVNSGDVANKSYVDAHAGGGGGIAEAPSDGKTYARQNVAWVSTYDGGAY
jgi:hypothetical protein